jgi:glutamate-1-semialdehyde 2,1-aminomutase
MVKRFNLLLRERGILKSTSKYYVSLAHTPEDVHQTIEAWASALEELSKTSKLNA